MSTFVTFREVRIHTLNGEAVESLRDLAVNINHITHIFPAIEKDRCRICLSDEPTPFEVLGSLEDVVKMLNEEQFIHREYIH